MVLICGYYHVPHNLVEERTRIFKSFGITHFDTAQLYRNERQVSDLLIPDDYVTTKVFTSDPHKIQKMVKRSINRFSNKRINCMLLHRPVDEECWRELCKFSDEFEFIGISNYDIYTLKSLIEFCKTNSLKLPDVHQIELHPFVDIKEMMELCNENNIRVEGHTILTQTKFFNYPPLMELSSSFRVAPAQLLVMWAKGKCERLCISTSSSDHLKELVDAYEMRDIGDISEMDEWWKISPHRFYAKLTKVPHNLSSIPNSEDLVNHIVKTLLEDTTSEYPSDLCDELPLTGYAFKSTGVRISSLLFPGLSRDSALSHYRTLVKNLRNKRISQRKDAKLLKKGLRTCNIREKASSSSENIQSSSYSPSITDPKPMPVDVSAPGDFIPFFSYLTGVSSLPYAPVSFVKGTMFPDGRMDMCKQVVGPTSIKELCNVVRRSEIVKHFLLGNNVALQTNEIEGAKDISSVMHDNTKSIETWYLAGNCISFVGIEYMAEALKYNTVAKALWLKRNPIGPIGAHHLNNMLRINKNLVLLDLHNCGLGDEGLQNLLEKPEELSALKHLYVDANAIETVTPIVGWFKYGKAESLYISINRLGDKGAIELAEGLRGNQNLKRLCLASTHLTNLGFKRLVESIIECPKLRCFNVGCYKSSSDMGEHPGNFFDDDVIPDIINLFDNSKSLRYFNSLGSNMTKERSSEIPKKSDLTMDIVGCVWYVHNKSQLRSIKHPRRVFHIDSIYRGKM